MGPATAPIINFPKIEGKQTQERIYPRSSARPGMQPLGPSPVLQSSCVPCLCPHLGLHSPHASHLYMIKSNKEMAA